VAIYRLRTHTHTHTLLHIQAESRLRVDIRYPIYYAPPKPVHSVFKIRKQEKHATMDVEYTGVQNGSLCVQIIADSKTCFGMIIIFNFCLQLREK
jgi:hypothetical protein